MLSQGSTDTTSTSVGYHHVFIVSKTTESLWVSFFSELGHSNKQLWRTDSNIIVENIFLMKKKGVIYIYIYIYIRDSANLVPKFFSLSEPCSQQHLAGSEGKGRIGSGRGQSRGVVTLCWVERISHEYRCSHCFTLTRNKVITRVTINHPRPPPLQL